MSLYTADTVHSLLLEKELLTAQDIITGDYEATSINRRNRNVQVTTIHGKNYLVKQVFDKNSENAKTLTVELSFYQYIKEYFPKIQGSFPKVNYANAHEVLLILEFYQEAIPLWKYYREKGIAKMPMKTIGAAGKLLGEMHKAFHEMTDFSLLFLSKKVPFAFELHKPHPKILSYMRKGGLQLIEHLQQDENLVHIFEDLEKQWQINSMIHGDIKLDNMLVIPQESSEESECLKLIDWEMAQYGDRAWDVAGGLQDFIFWWVIMMPNEDTPEAMIQKAPFTFKELQPGVQAYWHSYAKAYQDFKEPEESFLTRAVLFAGLRCLQTAYEIATKFETIPAIAMILLNMGKSIMKDPQMAKEKLFMLSPQTTTP